MIELYGMSSPNVRKIVIALEEMALPYRTRHVAVFRGAQYERDFLALNPMAKVPLIFDRDGPAGPDPIFESGAILLYLAENYGTEFLATSGSERWSVIKWLMIQVANVGPMFGQHSHFRMIADENPYAATRFRKGASQVYRALDTRLTEASYLGGDHYSIADMATYPWARYLRRHGLRDADFPALIDWKRRISERPAVIRAAQMLDQMGEGDLADRAVATPEEIDRFFGRHIVAPTAEEAATTVAHSKNIPG